MKAFEDLNRIVVADIGLKLCGNGATRLRILFELLVLHPKVNKYQNKP